MWMSRTKYSLTAILLVFALGMGGCAKVNDKTLGWFSSGVDAYAIVSGQLLTGDVVLIPDRTGRLALSAKSGPVTTCAGSMRHTAVSSGMIDLRCNNGAMAQLQFTLITETRGYAYGKSDDGPVSLTFGLPATDARAFLTVPEGKKLVESAKGGELTLEPQ
jgi:hypothetical protein